MFTTKFWGFNVRLFVISWCIFIIRIFIKFVWPFFAVNAVCYSSDWWRWQVRACASNFGFYDRFIISVNEFFQYNQQIKFWRSSYFQLLGKYSLIAIICVKLYTMADLKHHLGGGGTPTFFNLLSFFCYCSWKLNQLCHIFHYFLQFGKETDVPPPPPPRIHHWS